MDPNIAIEVKCTKFLLNIGFGVYSVYVEEEEKTSLLPRLQVQTLPNATQPISKIYPFTKMAVTFEPVVQF